MQRRVSPSRLPLLRRQRYATVPRRATALGAAAAAAAAASASLLAGEEPPWASLAEEAEPSEPPASWDRLDNSLNAATGDVLQHAMTSAATSDQRLLSRSPRSLAEILERRMAGGVSPIPTPPGTPPDSRRESLA